MVYDPLHEDNLARSVVGALEREAPCALGNIEQFEGAGIYAIYYTGSNRLYRPIAGQPDDLSQPIYVGKAVRAGSRKGQVSSGSTTALRHRLDEHRMSIEAATNLQIDDFWFRALVVSSIWIAPAESMMIARYQPVWNVIADGFGNHDPGEGRRGTKKSRWDTLHPGRAWATKLSPHRESRTDIRLAIKDHWNSASGRAPSTPVPATSAGQLVLGGRLTPSCHQAETSHKEGAVRKCGPFNLWRATAGAHVRTAATLDAITSANVTGTAFPSWRMVSVQEPQKR